MSPAPVLLGALLLWAGEALPADPSVAPPAPPVPPAAVAMPDPPAPPAPPRIAAAHPRSEAPRPPRYASAVVHPHAAPTPPRPPSPPGWPHAAPTPPRPPGWPHAAPVPPQPPAVVMAHPPARAPRATWSMTVGGHGPRLGTRVTDMTPQLRSFFGAPDDAGLLVQAVEPGSAAEGAAVKVGDVIVAVDGQPIARASDVQRALAGHQAGDELEVEVVRKKRRKTLRATLSDDGSPTVVVPSGTRFDHDMGVPPEALRALPPEVRRQVRRQLEHARRQLREAEKSIEASPPEVREDARRELEQVQQQLREVEQILEALDGKTPEAKAPKAKSSDGKRKKKKGNKAPRARRKAKKKGEAS